MMEEPDYNIKPCKNTSKYNLKAVPKEGAAYNREVKVLAKMQDTGNGYIFKFPTHSCVYQDEYICLDYAQADYIRQMLNQWNNHDV
jgi:hypothetical protein